VAAALVDYYEAGVTSLLIRGFDPLNDVVEYGRELLPLVHAEVARRDREAAAQPAAVAAVGGTR
jgi:alkanesulfonate monooxygenase